MVTFSDADINNFPFHTPGISRAVSLYVNYDMLPRLCQWSFHNYRTARRRKFVVLCQKTPAVALPPGANGESTRAVPDFPDAPIIPVPCRGDHRSPAGNEMYLFYLLSPVARAPGPFPSPRGAPNTKRSRISGSSPFIYSVFSASASPAPPALPAPASQTSSTPMSAGLTPSMRSPRMAV